MIKDFYNADFILSVSNAGDLFSNNAIKIKEEYKALVKIWHPDVNKTLNSSCVLSKINMLYEQALELIKNNQWEKTGLIQLCTINNKILNIEFISYVDFELGKIYICDDYIIYLFDYDKQEFYKNMLERISKLKFYDKSMQNEFKESLPNVLSYYYLKNGSYCIIIKKSHDVFMLSDVLRYYKNDFDDRHAAWIISRLLNLECYFEFSGIVHNGINIHNCFICPKNHRVFIYGGFWYMTNINEKMLGVSKEIFNVMPIHTKNTKCSSTASDLESIKLLGRILLKKNTHVPLSFKKWLENGCLNTAIEELERWDNTIIKAYGRRKFIKMDITKNDIYNV